MKVTYSIPDMHCNHCAMRLEGLEDELAGVTKVEASYHKQSMTVEFDPAALSEAQLVAAIAEKGYTAKAQA